MSHTVTLQDHISHPLEHLSCALQSSFYGMVSVGSDGYRARWENEKNEKDSLH